MKPLQSLPETEDGASSFTANHSVQKAAALMGCLVDAPDGQTLSQLARRTGLNVSTAYRILRTLTATGVLFRHEGEDRYVAGPMLLALAGATYGAAGFGRVLDELRGLSAATGEASSLGLRDGTCLAVIFAVPSPRGGHGGHRPGARIDLHCSSMGKTILASGKEPDLGRRVAGLGALRPMTPHSLSDPAALLDALELTRRRGYAVGRNEHTIGVTSVAVALPDVSWRKGSAVGLQVPNSRWSPEREAELVSALSSAAGRLAQLPELSRLPVS